MGKLTSSHLLGNGVPIPDLGSHIRAGAMRLHHSPGLPGASVNCFLLARRRYRASPAPPKGPTSQSLPELGSHLGKQPRIEGRQATLEPPPPSAGGGVPFAPDPNCKNEKNQNRKNASDDRPKLFTNSKFRMIFVALIPVINYNAQIAFKKG